MSEINKQKRKQKRTKQGINKTVERNVHCAHAKVKTKPKKIMQMQRKCNSTTNRSTEHFTPCHIWNYRKKRKKNKNNNKVNTNIENRTIFFNAGNGWKNRG